MANEVAKSGISSFDEFVRVHAFLLASAGLPAELHLQLFEKLSGSIFDGGDYFHIQPCEGGRQYRLLLSCPRLARNSQVFLVDHAWSFRLPEARKQLNEISGLAERMANLMCVRDDPEIGDNVSESGQPEEQHPNFEAIIQSIKAEAKEQGKEVLWLELDEQGLTDEDLLHLGIPTQFPNLVGLSLWGNKLTSLEVVHGVIKKMDKLRALWLNETPVDINMGKALRKAIFSGDTTLEIYNSEFTKNYTEWAVGFCSGVYGPESPVEVSSSIHPFKEVQALDLSNRKLTTLPAKIFNSSNFPMLMSLNLRGNSIEDEFTSSLFETLRMLVSLRSLQIDIPGPLGSSAVKIAESLPNLFDVNGVSVTMIQEQDKEIVDSDLHPRLPVSTHGEPLVERVLNAMWLYVSTYRLSDEEKLDESPVWYVMDELGSALRHSDVPNFKVAPFMFLPDGTLKSAISYTLLWPVQAVEQGDECSRDYLNGVGEEQQRSSRLTAWFHTPKSFFRKAYDFHWQNVLSKRIRKLEQNGASLVSRKVPKAASEASPLSVYTDIPQVLNFFNRPEFVLVDDPEEAQILWTAAQIKSSGEDGFQARPDQYINQFPFEASLVMKHFLAETIQQAYGAPSWFQPTYNMESQLAALIGDYMKREEENQDNLWIVKPWNMARTIDTTVTRNLSALIRLVETGPKVCQKYIEKPALYQGRKFDLRYIVLVRSIRPLEIFLSGVFWARLSNNQYTIEEQSLLEYETHFTVMNYGGRKLNHINTSQFVPEFEKEHNVRWADIQERVKFMIRSVFEGAAELHPDMHCPMARAIYGVDVMLDSNFNPKLLEVTFCPDCTRACTYDFQDLTTGEVIKGSEFFNHVFGCLFANEMRHVQSI